MYDFGTITYGLNNVIQEGGWNMKSYPTYANGTGTGGGNGTIASYTLSRPLDNTEQLDFSIHDPNGDDRSGGNGPVDQQCEIWVVSVGGNVTAGTPPTVANQRYDIPYVPTCFRLWHA